MKLSILYESRDPRRPTDLMLVAAPPQPGAASRYPVNFYSGKLGGLSQGKIVLGYRDANGRLNVTGRVTEIIQSKKNPDTWLVVTVKDGTNTYYYKITMPAATMQATYDRYLKRHIEVYQTYDATTGEMKRDVAELDLIFDSYRWEYFKGDPVVDERTGRPIMPPKNPKTSIEACNYLIYWAYHNHEVNKVDIQELIGYLRSGKRLKEGIRNLIQRYPNALEPAIQKIDEVRQDKSKSESESETFSDSTSDSDSVSMPAAPNAEPSEATSKTYDQLYAIVTGENEKYIPPSMMESFIKPVLEIMQEYSHSPSSHFEAYNERAIDAIFILLDAAHTLNQGQEFVWGGNTLSTYEELTALPFVSSQDVEWAVKVSRDNDIYDYFNKLLSTLGNFARIAGIELTRS